MNRWAEGFFGRHSIADWRRQLAFTTITFRARGLHLDDRHVRWSDGVGFSASIVDATLFVSANHERLADRGASLVLYLPKIQTAEEAALWHDLLSALEQQRWLPPASSKTYVLVEQIEASFQLMEIRAALGRRFVGFNTGRCGLHEQRVGRGGARSGVPQSQHRRDHDDLRLHAVLRGSRAPGRSTRPIAPAATRCGRAAWSRTSR